MPLGPQSAYAPEKQPPPGGYVTRTNDPNMKLALGRSVQLFYANDFTVPTYQDYCNAVGVMQYDIGVNGAAWMIASVQALQIRRSTIGAKTPLSYNEIVNNVSACPTVLNVAESSQRFSNLRARFRWNDGSAAQRELTTDVGGGISIQVYARNINVDVLFPNEGFFAQGGNFNGDPVIDTGASLDPVYDAVLSSRCAPVDSLGAYLLSRSPQLTEVERTNSATSSLFPIPSGATRATVSVGTLGPTRAISEYRVYTGRDAIRYPNPSPGSATATIDVSGVAEAIEIVSTAAGPTENVFQVVYEINP